MKSQRFYSFPRFRHRWIYPAVVRNEKWERWNFTGLYIGVGLILFGVLLSVSEVVRILYGPTNRGIRNYDESNEALLSKLQDDFSFPIRIEKFHYWPWTYAANLFGLVIITTGIVGIISSLRRSYSSIFTFLTLNLLSSMLSGYLIGYYSILINYYDTRNLDKPSNRPNTMDTSYGLICSNLAFSCLCCVLNIIGFRISFFAIKAGRPKGKSITPIKLRNI